MNRKLVNSLILSACLLGAACDDDADRPAPGQETPGGMERVFPQIAEGNGDLNVIGCDLYDPTGADTAVGFKPCVKAWVYADLSQLKKPGDVLSDVLVLSQVKDKTLPGQLGLIKFDDWTVKFERTAAGEDVLIINGLGFKKENLQRDMKNTVPFREGVHMTTFITSDPKDPGNLAEQQTFPMKCEVSFKRR
jgi:hypothetical protein